MSIITVTWVSWKRLQQRVGWCQERVVQMAITGGKIQTNLTGSFDIAYVLVNRRILDTQPIGLTDDKPFQV